jgi:hypothetical protein
VHPQKSASSQLQTLRSARHPEAFASKLRRDRLNQLDTRDESELFSDTVDCPFCEVPMALVSQGRSLWYECPTCWHNTGGQA